jgi:hypothetical protein
MAGTVLMCGRPLILDNSRITAARPRRRRRSGLIDIAPQASPLARLR